jgi:hypothetical protein
MVFLANPTIFKIAGLTGVILGLFFHGLLSANPPPAGP